MSTTRRDAHVHYEGNQMTITAPYDGDFRSELMSHTVSRRWNPEKKVWILDIGERDKALDLIRRFFTITEDNSPARSESLIQVEPKDPVSSERPLEIETGQHVDVWTDGACVGNPGPGGYAALFRHKRRDRELVGGFRLTTNNRMEIMAAIVALEALPCKCIVTMYSDSRYLVDAIMKGWAKRWRSKGWKRNRKGKALNADLWQRLLGLCDIHKVKFKWVEGHASSRENLRCDQLAEGAARSENLPIDTGYEKE